MSAYLRIVNWDSLQHYKERNPPWIKLHKNLLTSETWVSSSNDDRALAVAIMLLAAASGNRVPANPRYIQRVAYLEKEPDLSGLIALKFIEYIEENAVASKVLASARPETENREREDTLEPDGSNGADAPQVTPVDLTAAVWESGVALLTSRGSPARNARSMIGRWLKDYGDAPVLAVLSDAQLRPIVDPIPWIKRTLETRYGNLASPSRGSGALELIHRGERLERAAEDAEADRGTWPPLPAAIGG